MKKSILLIWACIFFFCTYAQDSGDKYDTILMKNNETKVGTVKQMSDDEVNFVHKGETLVYKLKKDNIVRITFSSGRVENINEPAAGNNTGNTGNTDNAAAKTDHHNKAAVLPFSFISNQEGGDPEMGYKIQGECYNYFSGKASAIEFQDPATTNALLGKAGVTTENYRNFTMTEISDFLGVEYIVRGTVTSNQTQTSTRESATYNEKSKKNNSGKSSDNKSSSGTVTSTSSTQKEYKTSVLLEIYTDAGKKIFGKEHTSFWSGVNAYKNAIQFLLKKSPIYGR